MHLILIVFKHWFLFEIDTTFPEMASNTLILQMERLRLQQSRHYTESHRISWWQRKGLNAGPLSPQPKFSPASLIQQHPDISQVETQLLFSTSVSRALLLGVRVGVEWQVAPLSNPTLEDSEPLTLNWNLQWRLVPCCKLWTVIGIIGRKHNNEKHLNLLLLRIFRSIAPF